MLLLMHTFPESGGTPPGDSSPGYGGWGAALFISLLLMVVTHG